MTGDPTLPDRLRRLAAALDRHHDIVGAATAREAAGVIERAVDLGNVGVPAQPADPPARPETWPTCVAAGCTTRVDPWDHQTRCSVHRPDPDAPLEVRRHVKVPET